MTETARRELTGGPFLVKIPAGVHKSAIEKSISILYNTSLNLNRIGRFC